MSRIIRLLTSVGALLYADHWARAGNDHIEDSRTDAGSSRQTAKVIYKSPHRLRLQMIQGYLGPPSSQRGIDREDLYVIQITSPSNFVATTDVNQCVVSDIDGINYCAGAVFDAQLWLFRLDENDNAIGLLASDNITKKNTAGRILPNATDGSGAQVTTPGIYILGITAAGNDPVSARGPIFNQASSTEISGPDGLGGTSPLKSWTGNGSAEPGEYTIVLYGAEGLCAPGACPASSKTGRLAAAIALLCMGAFIFVPR